MSTIPSPRPPASRWPARAWYALLPAVTLLLAACTDLSVEPAARAPAAVALSVSLPADAGSATAYRKVDQVRLRLTREEVAVLDTTFAFQEEMRLNVGLAASQETMQLRVELLRAADVLFRGSTDVLLRAGGSTEVSLALEAVPAGVRAQPPVLENQSLGETVQLAGAVLFATGDPIMGLALSWQALDPAVVEVTSDGRLTSRAEGAARVEGRFGAFADTVAVQVSAVVASLEVEPTTPTLPVDQTLQLTAVLRDARGNVLSPRDPQGAPISTRVVTWSSSLSRVAQVDQQSGLVRGLAPGTATITATTSENRSGSARVEVTPLPPVLTNCRTSDFSGTVALVICMVNPNQALTSVRFEWGPTTSLGNTTPSRSLPGSAAQEVGELLANLSPGTRYYWRAVASNAGGTTVGPILSFTTAPLPSYTLTILGGTAIGFGVVTGPGGINCTIASGSRSGTCQASFTSGTQVILTATAGSGYVFAGWSGACTGTAGTCPLVMDANKSATATFVLLIRDPPPASRRADDPP